MASAAAPNDGTTMATPAGMARARWLALGGALLWLYASWAPWAIIIPHRALVAPEPYVSPAGLPAVSAVAVDPTVLGIVSSIGLLLCPWLWSRRYRVVAGALYLAWVALASLIALVTLVGYARVASTLPLSLTAPVGVGISPDFGLVVLLGALGLAWAAGVGLWRTAMAQVRRVGLRATMRGERRERPTRDAPAEVFARTGLMGGGASTVLAGVVIWALGYYLMPWVIDSTCPDTAVVVGCAGLSASDAVAIAAASAGAVLDPRVFLYAVPVVLGICGLLMIYAVRRLLVNAVLCIWVGCWAATATVIEVLGWVGRDQPGGVSAERVNSPGAAVAAIGIGIVWLGLVPLVIAAIATWQARATAAARP